MSDADRLQEVCHRNRHKSWQWGQFVADRTREFVGCRRNQNYHYTHRNKNRHELRSYTHNTPAFHSRCRQIVMRCTQRRSSDVPARS
jgi:hypothetical protein